MENSESDIPTSKLPAITISVCGFEDSVAGALALLVSDEITSMPLNISFKKLAVAY